MPILSGGVDPPAIQTDQINGRSVVQLSAAQLQRMTEIGRNVGGLVGGDPTQMKLFILAVLAAGVKSEQGDRTQREYSFLFRRWRLHHHQQSNKEEEADFMVSFTNGLSQVRELGNILRTQLQPGHQ